MKLKLKWNDNKSCENNSWIIVWAFLKLLYLFILKFNGYEILIKSYIINQFKTMVDVIFKISIIKVNTFILHECLWLIEGLSCVFIFIVCI